MRMGWQFRVQPQTSRDGYAHPYVRDDRLFTILAYDMSADGLRGTFAVLLDAPGVAPGASAPVRVIDFASEHRGVNPRFVDASESVMGFSTEQGVAYIPLRSRDPVRVIREPVGALYSDVVVQGELLFWEAGFSAGSALRSEE
jgi:hypothetical protein